MKTWKIILPIAYWIIGITLTSLYIKAQLEKAKGSVFTLIQPVPDVVAQKYPSITICPPFDPTLKSARHNRSINQIMPALVNEFLKGEAYFACGRQVYFGKDTICLVFDEDPIVQKTLNIKDISDCNPRVGSSWYKRCPPEGLNTGKSTVFPVNMDKCGSTRLYNLVTSNVQFSADPTWTAASSLSSVRMLLKTEHFPQGGYGSPVQAAFTTKNSSWQPGANTYKDNFLYLHPTTTICPYKQMSSIALTHTLNDDKQMDDDLFSAVNTECKLDRYETATHAINANIRDSPYDYDLSITFDTLQTTRKCSQRTFTTVSAISTVGGTMSFLMLLMWVFVAAFKMCKSVKKIINGEDPYEDEEEDTIGYYRGDIDMTTYSSL